MISRLDLIDTNNRKTISHKIHPSISPNVLALNALTIEEVSHHLQAIIHDKIIELFNETVCFSFVFGSITNKQACFDDELNVFICLNKRNPSLEQLFNSFLINLLIEFGLHPNPENPSEIMSMKELNCALNADYTNLSNTLGSFSRWSPIIASNKRVIIDNFSFIESFENRCRMHAEKFNERIIDEIKNTTNYFTFKNHGKENIKNTYIARNDALMASYDFNVDFCKLQSITSINSNKKLDFVLSQIREFHAEIIPEHSKIMLDGANGNFETYKVVQLAYQEALSDLRQYIPFNDQYFFNNSNHDRRKTLMQFLVQMGIAKKESYDDVNSIVTGHGSGYILNKAIQVINNNKGHVFLIPVPTYGYFIPAISSCGAKPLFIDTIPYTRYELPANILESIIINKNQELYEQNIKEFIFKFIKFFNNLKLKLLLKEKNDLEIDLEATDNEMYTSAIYFKKYLTSNRSDFKCKDFEQLMVDFPEIPRVKCLFFINPHNPLGVIFEQEYIDSIASVANKYDIAIIDDLSHMELIHNNGLIRKMGFFNQSPFPIDVITLLSPSKSLCMAECRVGFALINNLNLVEQYKELVFNDGVFLSKKQLCALEHAFIINPERKRYLSKNSIEYSRRMDLMKFIIHPELRPLIDSDNLATIKETFKLYNFNENDYTDGLCGIKMVNKNPESGFFCILDFSILKGKYFIDSQIIDNYDLSSLLCINNIIALTGDNIFYTDKLVIRFPICEPPLLILAAIKRIKQMMLHISCEPFIFNPENNDSNTSSLFISSIGRDRFFSNAMTSTTIEKEKETTHNLAI